MADFLWEQNPHTSQPDRFKKLYNEDNFLRLTDRLTVHGYEKTYFHRKRENGDFIVAIGSCYYPGKTIAASLEDILDTGTFDGATIARLKTELVGQYILVIKKGGTLYFLNDNWQVRQIFYSPNPHIIASSLSVLEERLTTGSQYPDEYKIFEYLAAQYVYYYPAWFNNGTMHKGIFFLRPFEYIEMDAATGHGEIKSIQFRIDNKKETHLESLVNRFIDTLKAIIENPAFRDQPVGLTLTGGYDSRLISSTAAPYYESSELRLGISRDIAASLEDLTIAEKVARRLKRPLRKCYTTDESRENFNFYTEGMSPPQNCVIAPLIEEAGRYAVGFGGIFGTELFKPLPIYSSAADFAAKRIAHARKYMKAGENLWQQLEASIIAEIMDIEKHYLLSEPDINDHIHILYLLHTGFFGSFMLAPYNIKGLQVEPYGHFKILDLVMKLHPSFKPYSILLGNGFLQKEAMARINYRAGKITTTHQRPLLPLSARTLPAYLYPFLANKFRIHLQLFKIRWNIGKRDDQQKVFETLANDIQIVPNGREIFFKERIEKKYRTNP